MANFAPEVDLNGVEEGFDSSATYTENDPVTPLAPDATVSDGDSADFDEGGLVVAFTAGGTADDQLRITGEDFVVEETDLYYQGIPVATIVGGTDGSTPLYVTFNASVTPAIAAALIRAVGYATSSETPQPGQRQISFTLTDGDGGTSVARVATVDVATADSPPTARDDAIATNENMVGTGSLFADNGSGPDSDLDGPALVVAEVNGSADNVGVVLILESGARLTVNDDGTYVYDPNGRFDSLADPGSGAANTSVVADSFTYGLEGGGSAVVTVTVNGVASPGDRLLGDEGDNGVVGTPGPDIFVLDQGGNDFARGLGGDDIFYFGAALTAQDVVDAGDGYDTIVLQGDYGQDLVLDGNVTGIEAISMLAWTNRSFGSDGEGPHSYSITTHDSNFAAGIRAKINGSALQAGEDFFFDGSAETDSSFIVYGGGGADVLIGGRGDDIFFFAPGRFAAGDRVAGGDGYDGLFLRGDYTLDFGDPGFAGLLTGIENLTLTSASDTRYARGGGSAFHYDLTLADSIVGPGQTLTISGALLMATETMVLDGSQETDGFLRLFGGSANDSLTGGARADLIYGGLGGDALIGGGGADLFRYQATGESSGNSADHILDFTPGTDRIDLSRMDADALTAGDQAFAWIGSEAFSGAAGELRAFASGQDRIVEGDVDGDGLADLVITLTLQGPVPLGAGDFVL